ncbi:hypothetical protein KUL113_32150 [Tenacibaculum sp. KUL113]|nr:hypothetical protein KUL113_32150 [Tenacibaculum sp. KUL113]
MRKILLIIVVAFLSFNVSAASLKEAFSNPGDAHKPWVFWYWINGNVTEEGIKADLESMSNAGLGGVVLMHINEHHVIPAGPVKFLSEDYLSLLAFTFEKASELGLKVNLYNSEGWSVAGGPWISPKDGMKELSWSEQQIRDRFQPITFPAPHAPLNFYEDIAVLAFPTPKAHIEPKFQERVASVNISGTASQSTVVAKNAIDGDWNTLVYPNIDEETKQRFIQIDFSEEFTFRNAFVKFAAYGMMGMNRLLVSDDGKNYREIAFSKRGQIYDDLSCFQFEPIKAKHAKIVFQPTDNKLLYTAMPKVDVAVREVIFDNKPRTANWCQKAAHIFPFHMQETEREAMNASFKSDASINADSIVDVSQYLDESGRLNWTPPNDDWTVIRFGMSSTEAVNRPGSEGGEGLEVDKLSERALDIHFEHYIKRNAERSQKYVGDSFVSTHADSWEVGRQNWTQGFEKDFEERRGYSLIRLLPVTLGYVVKDATFSERILWDYRKTLAELIAERFYGGMQQRANELGLTFSAQSMKPFIDNLQALGQADIIYANSAFRSTNPLENKPNQEFAYLTAKMAASAGSIYNKPVRSESFTSLPQANRWLSHPLTYKSQADTDLAAGVTLTTHHLFTHQPWTTLKPGMTLGYWGIHFERTQTWWHEVETWNKYLTRSHALLSMGQPVLDVLHLLGDDSATTFDRDFALRELPEGYDFEFISTNGVMNHVNVNDQGQLALESGRTYNILSISPDVSMRVEVLEQIKSLLERGVTVVGLPPTFSPSLEGSLDTSGTDQRVNQLAGDIWGARFNNQVFENLEDALNHKGILPDVLISHTDNRFVWRHHNISEENTDVYFISNLDHMSAEIELDLRAKGKVAEIWDPLSGKRLLASDYVVENGRSRFKLHFDQAQSLFVVLAPQKSTGQLLNTLPLRQLQILDSPWQVDFIKGVKKPNALALNELIDLSQHADEDVKYFSGTVRYETEFEMADDLPTSQSYLLNLGEAFQFARVRLNGHDLGLRMWAPYHFNISNIIRSGANRLEIEVTTLWPNRLIGDERLYPDTAAWKKNGYQGSQLTSFPKWLKGAAPEQPGSRSTFATWKHWNKDDELLPSGLLGPVSIMVQDRN